MQQSTSESVNWYDDRYTATTVSSQPGDTLVKRDTQRVYLRFATSQDKGTYGVMHEGFFNQGFTLGDLVHAEPVGANIPAVVVTSTNDPWLCQGAWKLCLAGALPPQASFLLVYEVFLRRGPLCSKQQVTMGKPLSARQTARLSDQMKSGSGLSYPAQRQILFPSPFLKGLRSVIEDSR